MAIDNINDVHIAIPQAAIAGCTENKRNVIARVKIKTSNKIKKVIATWVKLSVAYKNKGGKTDNVRKNQIAEKVDVIFSFFVHMYIGRGVMKIVRNEPEKAIITIVSLVKPCVM